jgi:general L-amino acid transport system substrate-binding protein
VRWVLHALVLAEERGITRASTGALRLAPGKNEWLARALGVREGWLERAVQAVGHYGELFDRNLGEGSPLKLERGPNRPWTQGGLLYAPPLD